MASKRGRPSKYTAAIAQAICERLAAGETLRAICRDEKMPCEATVRHWALADAHGFFARYAQAREIGYHGMFDEVKEIADTPQQGVRTKMLSDGKTEEQWGDMIEHRRLQVDARKWMLAKALPKVYGDRQTHEVEVGASERLLALIEAGISRAAQR